MPRADNGREIVSQILAMSTASMERDQVARFWGNWNARWDEWPGDIKQRKARLRKSWPELTSLLDQVANTYKQERK